MQSSDKSRAGVALRDLQAFLETQRVLAARGAVVPTIHSYEPVFLARATRAIEAALPEELQALLADFAGTGHFLGGYAQDSLGLDTRLDALYAAVASLMLATRRQGNSTEHPNER